MSKFNWLNRLKAADAETLARYAFIAAAGFLGFTAIFMAGFYNGAKDTPIRRAVFTLKESATLLVSEADTIAGRRPAQWTEPRRYPGAGVTINTYPADAGELILIQSFFDNGLEIRLINRAGDTVRRWPLSPFDLIGTISTVKNMPTSAWNFNSHGMAVHSDGSLVFNIDHHGLLKVDRCGDVVWRVAEPTHHAVSLASNGAYWAPGTHNRRVGDEAPHGLFPAPVAEDTLLNIGPQGDILREISVIDVMIRSNAIGYLTLAGGSTPSSYSTGRPDFDREVFHLNDVEPLPDGWADRFEGFEAGDLLVSLRNRNLIMVVDPDTETIKWSHIGSWSRQHDPDWMPDGRIAVFDNARDGTIQGRILGSSRIIAVDPNTKEETVLYGGATDFFHTTRRGKQQILPDGRILITEAEAGRIFEVDRTGDILWEFVHGFDERFAFNISEAIAVPRGFFKVSDWNC